MTIPLTMTALAGLGQSVHGRAVALAADPPPLPHTHSDGTLILALLLGIAVIVLLIVRAKMHPFLALIIGSGVLAGVARVPVDRLFDSFSTGLGSTVSGVGVLIALGAIIGKLLADSGGANQVADTILAKSGRRSLPWAMALIAVLLGLPLFFEVGIVLLIPIVLLVARRGNASLLRIGIPALAGLSALHGLVPPHPGPLVAIDALHASLGVTLALGLLVAVPSVIVAGPLYARIADRWIGRVPVPVAVGEAAVELPADGPAADAGSTAPGRVGGDGRLSPTAQSAQTLTAPADPTAGSAADDPNPPRRPSFAATMVTILLPVVLMLLKALCDIAVDNPKATPQRVFDFVGSPLIALLAAAIVAMFTLGRAAGFTRGRISETVSRSLAPMAGIILIVGAGGGFKQTLVDVGVGDVVAHWATASHISVLLLGWLVAVGIRLATGSATVATITAAGIVSPLAANLSTTHAALLVLAVGAGSVFFSHVNDAGFWLVKEYFGMSIGQTLKSWSAMETVLSVTALICVLLLGLVV